MRWALFGFAWLMVPAEATAQGEPPTRQIQATVKAEYDSFFGFYPTLSLAHSLDSLRQLTGYATYYTQPGSAGLDVGTTLSLTYPRLGITVVPAVGLLSGGFFGPGRGFLVSEGYTGSLAAEKAWSRLAVGAAGGYFGLLRRKTPDVYNIAYYHLEAGYKLTKAFTVGVLHERILAVRQAHNEGDTSEFALARVGAFGRGQLPGGFQAELAGGWLNGGFVRASLSRALARLKPLDRPAPP